MPDPTQRQVRGAGTTDLFLTNVSVSFMQSADSFVADQVFPVVPVGASTARYKVFPRSYFAMDNVGPRPLGGYPRQTGYRLSEDSYNAEEQALEAWVDDRERSDADASGHDIERAKVRLLTNQHLIHRDRDWASAYFRTGVWGSDRVGVAASPTGTQFLQLDSDNSDPIAMFSADQLASHQTNGGYPLSTLVLGAAVYTRLVNHPDIVARLGDNATRIVTREVLARLLGVDRILVPMGVYNSGPEKETVAATEAAAVYSFIVGSKDALLVHAATDPGTDTPSGGYIFAWNGLLGGNAFSTAAVNRGRDDRAYSDWFHVRMAYDMKVVSPTLGIFYSGAVA